MSQIKKYHLTGSQNFYGVKDAYTYYNVPARKVWNGLRYMCNEFGLKNVFVYDASGSIGKNIYIGSYSLKYDNFRTPDNKLHKTFNF